MSTADNVQQQILDAVADALRQGGLDVLGVYVDHCDPLALADKLPAVLVEAGPDGESVQQAAVSGLEERAFSVRVAYLVAQADGYASKARSLGAAGERVLAVATFKPAGLRGRCSQTSNEIVLTSRAEKPLAAYQQTWRVTYYARRGQPQTAL